jgi:hypothetical protein
VSSLLHVVIVVATHPTACAVSGVRVSLLTLTARFFFVYKKIIAYGFIPKPSKAQTNPHPHKPLKHQSFETIQSTK